MLHPKFQERHGFRIQVVAQNSECEVISLHYLSSFVIPITKEDWWFERYTVNTEIWSQVVVQEH
jgi:hypothetical protein